MNRFYISLYLGFIQIYKFQISNSKIVTHFTVGAHCNVPLRYTVKVSI
jgi:hypothetical protein